MPTIEHIANRTGGLPVDNLRPFRVELQRSGVALQSAEIVVQARDDHHAGAVARRTVEAMSESDVLPLITSGAAASETAVNFESWTVQYAELVQAAPDMEAVIDEALNAAVLTVQKALGVDDGGFASMFFSGDTEEAFKDLFRSYVRSERALAAAAPPPRRRIRIVVDVEGDPAAIDAAARASFSKDESLSWDEYVGLGGRLSVGASEVIAEAFAYLDGGKGPPWEVCNVDAEDVGEAS